MVRYHDIFAKEVRIVEFLMGYEGDDFSAASDPRENLLGITAVHPMRDHAGHRYYLRRPRSAI